MKRHAIRQEPLNLTATLYPVLIDLKYRLKNRKTLTHDQAARLDAINAELERRDHDAAERRQNSQLSAAWDAYLFDN